MKALNVISKLVTTSRTSVSRASRTSREARCFTDAPTPAAQRLNSASRFSAHSLCIRLLMVKQSSKLCRQALEAWNMLCGSGWRLTAIVIDDDDAFMSHSIN